MEYDRTRLIAFAKTAGGAEAALISVKNLRLDVDARLLDEDFATPLATELEAMTERLEEIHGDLDSLAHARNPDVGWVVEHHRLANRGAELVDDDEIEFTPGPFSGQPGWHAKKGTLSSAALTKEGAARMIRRMEEARAAAVAA